jgi:hypothetical protein
MNQIPSFSITASRDSPSRRCFAASRRVLIVSDLSRCAVSRSELISRHSSIGTITAVGCPASDSRMPGGVRIVGRPDVGFSRLWPGWLLAGRCPRPALAIPPATASGRGAAIAVRHPHGTSAGRLDRAQHSRPVGVIGQNEAAVERTTAAGAANAHPGGVGFWWWRRTRRRGPRRLSLGCLWGGLARHTGSGTWAPRLGHHTIRT